MDPQITLQTYTVQPIPASMSPIGSPYLTDPTAIDAAYNATSQQITLTMSFTIPGDLDPNQVSVKQYFTSSQSSRLQFYICYSSASTATPQTVACTFTASNLDSAGNPIDLGAISKVFNMLKNATGPKSSRGILTSVRTTDV